MGVLYLHNWLFASKWWMHQNTRLKNRELCVSTANRASYVCLCFSAHVIAVSLKHDTNDRKNSKLHYQPQKYIKTWSRTLVNTGEQTKVIIFQTWIIHEGDPRFCFLIIKTSGSADDVQFQRLFSPWGSDNADCHLAAGWLRLFDIGASIRVKRGDISMFVSLWI